MLDTGLLYFLVFFSPCVFL
uniref:Uncharacterized protein n=1 Tax=Rhizophora mucronata TaxID=61149 RepID=A0A2P2P785_RHIMU